MRKIKATLMVITAVIGFALLSRFALDAFCDAIDYNNTHYARVR
jgi:hypothetical protein